MEPKVSVVMAVYNAEKYLSKSIESILNQTLDDYEFIIVNDGSIDRSLEIIRSYADKRIILLDKKNDGVARARNFGIDLAKGKFIAVQDADDISLNHRLEKQYNFLINHQDYVLVGTNAEMIDQDGNFVCYSNVKTSEEEVKKSLRKMPIYHPSVMFERSTFLKAGKYPEYMYNIAEDLILINKMGKYGRITNLFERLIKYRIVPNSCSKRTNRFDSELNKIVLKALSSDTISESDIDYLKNRLRNLESDDITANYYLYLAKKYLWNNYQPRLARKNAVKALRLRPFSIKTYPYFGLTFFPKQIILNMYKTFKKKV